MSTVNVIINGIEYNLRGEESEEYLQRVAAVVDKNLKNIIEKYDKIGLTSAAVLTAINAVDELLKKENIFDGIKTENASLAKQEKNFTEQIANLKKQLKAAETLNSQLQEKIKSNSDEMLIEKKDEEIEKLNKEFEILQETAKNYLNEKNSLMAENKELKFQIQSAKYKIIDLQNKLIENQIDLARLKKNAKK